MNHNCITLKLLLITRNFHIAYLRLKLRYLVIFQRKSLLKNLRRPMFRDEPIKPTKQSLDPFHGDARMTPNVESSATAPAGEVERKEKHE